MEESSKEVRTKRFFGHNKSRWPELYCVPRQYEVKISIRRSFVCFTVFQSWQVWSLTEVPVLQDNVLSSLSLNQSSACASLFSQYVAYLLV